jgi:GTP-binding protein Era
LNTNHNLPCPAAFPIFTPARQLQLSEIQLPETPDDFRCGYVALAGRPNVGKSTLLNAIIGQHLSIVSPKAQTTRERVAGILSEPGYQAVFIDAPGFIDAEYALQESMRLSAQAALDEADVVTFIADATRPKTMPDDVLIEALAVRSVPLLLALNKSDKVSSDTVASLLKRAEERSLEAIAISALTGSGLDKFLAWAVERLPLSPPLFPIDDSATQPLRFFAQEYVRETAMELLREEVPYSIITRVEEYREAQDPVYIAVTIYVERESQKGIVIGRGGSGIREIGRLSREKIEELIGERVYLDLRVKVMPGWSRKRNQLQGFGFQLPPER